MSLSIDDIASPSGNAWKPEVGDLVKGTILYVGTSIRESRFTGLDEESIRIDLDTGNGEITSVWAVKCTDVALDANGQRKGYPSRLARAIVAAVRAAGGTSIEHGATLAVKRVADVATDKGNPAKAYVAEYKPAPAPTVPVEDAADGAVTGLISD